MHVYGPRRPRARRLQPHPTVVHVGCLGVEDAGAVALVHVVGQAPYVVHSPAWDCDPVTPLPNGASVACRPLIMPTACASPQVFAMTSLGQDTIIGTVDCGITATASCTATAGPSSFCFAQAGLGTFDLTCKAETPTPGAHLAFTWWVQCSQPTV